MPLVSYNMLGLSATEVQLEGCGVRAAEEQQHCMLCLETGARYPGAACYPCWQCMWLLRGHGSCQVLLTLVSAELQAYMRVVEPLD
jgi:hypothetical protein